MWVDHMNLGSIIVAFLNLRHQPLYFLSILWSKKVKKRFPILLKMLGRVCSALTHNSLEV